MEPALERASRNAHLPSSLLSFYERRSFAPLWIRGEALSPAGSRLIATLAAADTEGLDPRRYLSQLVFPSGPRRGQPAAWAQTEISLTYSLARYAHDLTRAPAGFYYVHRDVPRREKDVERILRAVERGVPLDHAIASSSSANFLYRGLRKALADHRRGRSTGHDSRAILEGNPLEQTIIRNMHRTRALPAMSRGRFLIVDTAAARLLMIEDGKVQDEMLVIVGKPQEQTPDMAGELRFVVLNPYWNLPQDLVSRRARTVIQNGPAMLKAERLELLSDWGSNPRMLQVHEVDWQAVAERRSKLRMRQLPGPDNMMGRIKFMMPNPLGIYLHDTPFRQAFSQADRRLSSGCVRVEDADQLARWLFEGKAPKAGTSPEWRVDLPGPVPVYILYLTAMASDGRLLIRPDTYRRDPSTDAARLRPLLSASE